jgi:hypothetical protein
MRAGGAHIAIAGGNFGWGAARISLSAVRRTVFTKCAPPADRKIIRRVG